MKNNIQRLGNTLVSRMTRTADAAVGVYTDLGTINYNMSLTPDSLNEPIPSGDYLISEGADPQPNDRVVIAWCGNEPVVIGPAAAQRTPLPIRVTSDGAGNVTIRW